MKKTFMTFLVFIMCVQILMAQTDPVGQFNKYVFQNWKGDYVRVGQYKVKGTPYLFGESFPGQLKFGDGRKMDTKILYNLYEQKVGADINGNLLQSDQMPEEFTITLPQIYGGGTLFFKNSAKFGNNNFKSYFNVLEEGGKAAVLKIYKIKLLSDPSNMMDKDLKIFEQYYEYYIYLNSTKELKKIKLKEKDLGKALGDEDFVKKSLKNENLDVNKEADVVKLIRMYNSN